MKLQLCSFCFLSVIWTLHIGCSTYLKHCEEISDFAYKIFGKQEANVTSVSLHFYIGAQHYRGENSLSPCRTILSFKLEVKGDKQW